MPSKFGGIPVTEEVQPEVRVSRFGGAPVVQNVPIVPPPDLSQMGVMAGNPLNKELIESIPFVGAGNQFSEGMRSGEQLVGDNLGGAILGAILGGARAAGTALNPIGTLVNAAPKTAQAAGSMAGGDFYRGLNDLVGANPIRSAAEIPPINTGFPVVDIPVNTLTGIEGEVAKQPLLLAGATPKALAQQGVALRNFPGNVSKAASSVANTPLSQAITGTIKGAGNIVGGTAKALVKSVLPKSVETQLVDALNPGANPTQVQRATQAVRTVIPNASDIIQRSGSTFDSAAGARDVSRFGMDDIWAGIEQQTGQPILADASPVANAYLSIARDPVINRLFPEVIPQLESEAVKFQGQQIPVQQLEQIKQTFNAINQTKELMTKSKQAALQKSDPLYAATDKANQAIGTILEEQFGPEFTDAKRQWGAWKQINELANKQAIRQEILDNKVTPFEGLGILGAIAQGMATEGSLVRGASTALAGKALKYANSPDAKFSKVSKRLENP